MVKAHMLIFYHLCFNKYNKIIFKHITFTRFINLSMHMNFDMGRYNKLIQFNDDNRYIK